jgi:hypothetical protein
MNLVTPDKECSFEQLPPGNTDVAGFDFDVPQQQSDPPQQPKTKLATIHPKPASPAPAIVESLTELKQIKKDLADRILDLMDMAQLDANELDRLTAKR